MKRIGDHDAVKKFLGESPSEPIVHKQTDSESHVDRHEQDMFRRGYRKVYEQIGTTKYWTWQKNPYLDGDK